MKKTTFTDVVKEIRIARQNLEKYLKNKKITDLNRKKLFNQLDKFRIILNKILIYKVYK